MQDRFEPEWMFRQAEHFSICLRIPRDYLLEQLEEGWDFNSWAPVYRLAERFGVSPSMMRVRLEKLGIIEIGADGKPHLKPTAPQGGLFH
jgi:Zn-dependent peptidase ImmA (M78 family)